MPTPSLQIDSAMEDIRLREPYEIPEDPNNILYETE